LLSSTSGGPRSLESEEGHSRPNVHTTMREDPDHDKRSPDYSRCRNAARAAPLSGRIHPLKYTSPLDTKNLMTAEEFQARRILGKPGNRYTDNGDVAEIPSPEEATTPRTATSTTSASTEAETVLSGTTARTSASFPRKVDQNDDFAPNGWYIVFMGRSDDV
jgi:hypothetical protein